MEMKALENLLLVPTDDSVVFPSMTVTLAVEVGDEQRVLLIPRAGGRRYLVGTRLDLDPQGAARIAARGAGEPSVEPRELEGGGAPWEPDALRDLGHRAHVGEALALARYEQDALLIARVDREGHRHAGKDDGVVEGEE